MQPASGLFLKLRKLLRRKGCPTDGIDDLIQEAFLRLQVYCRDQAVRQPEAFLVRTVLNLLVDERRKSHAGVTMTGQVESLPLIDPNPTPDEVLTGEERLQQLEAGFQALSPKAREVFLLYRLEGYSYAQIAEHCDISLSMVEKHIAKATLFLLHWMNRE